MSNDWNRNGHIGFDSLNCNKKFSVQKENAPSLFSEKYDTCITLRNIICAVKTEDYHITAKLVTLMPDASSYYYSLCIVGKIPLTTTGERKK